MPSTCSLQTCCDAVPTCSSSSAAWLILQAAGGGCAEDTKFFDLKTLDAEVGGSQEEADVKAACCTPFAEAQCSDWNAMSCSSDTVVVATNSAPADGANGMTLSQDKFQELCCVTEPATCSSFSAAWLISQVVGAGCAQDTKFFDLKTLNAEVGMPQEEADVKAACCTPFAEALCSDWNTKSCSSDTVVVPTNTAPADGANGMTRSQDKFQELCCVTEPETCSSSSVAWLILQAAGGGCAEDTKFFDLKTLNAEVGGSQAEADVKAACCTPFAEAQCSDWNAMSCSSGTFAVGTNSAPADAADGDNGMTLSQDNFQELCCETAMKCKDFTEVVDATVPQTTASFFVLAMAATVVA